MSNPKSEIKAKLNAKSDFQPWLRAVKRECTRLGLLDNFNNCLIKIIVPHPRHDEFISDPTHVRPITILGLQLFDKDLNLKWEKQKGANTPLALINNVNFKVKNVRYNLDSNYLKKFENNNIDKSQVDKDVRELNNVVKEMVIDWEVIKN